MARRRSPAARSGHVAINVGPDGIARTPDELVGGHYFIRRDPTRKTPVRLPDYLEVSGNLSISDPTFEELPQSLAVHGDLVARGTRIRALPKDLGVRGRIDLSDTLIDRLPEGFTAVNSLILRRCHNLSELPQKLEVLGALSLVGTRVERIPPGVKARRINLGGRARLSLPDGLEVDVLDLRGSETTRLPSRLVVRAKLLLDGSKVTELPEDLSGGMVLVGSAPIRSISRTPKFQGLDLGGSDITELPRKFKILTLVVAGSRLRSLPPGMELRSSYSARTQTLSTGGVSSGHEYDDSSQST